MATVPREPSPPASPSEASGARAPGGHGDAGADAGSTCQGTLLGDAGEPVVGRSLALVDARGKRWDLMSDEAGMFHAIGVVVPYDVAIAPAPSGSIVVPVAYLGLTRTEATFRLHENDGAAPAESQVLSVSVNAPPCASGGCWVSVVSASASGGGASSRVLPAGAPVVTVDVAHAWRAASVPEGEEIVVHVLVGDEADETFSYARAAEITASPGDWTNVDVATSAVSSSASVVIHLASSDVPATWGRSFGWRLELGGGATMEVGRALAGAVPTVRVPLVPLATLRGALVASEPAGARAHAHVASWSALAWSAPIAPGAARVDLSASRGALLTAPGVDSGLSRGARGLQWATLPGSVVTASLHELARDRDVLRVHTSGSEVAWRRLVRLGIELPRPGEHVLELETRGATMPDDLVAPAPATQAGSGWTSRQRRRIVVTP